MLLSRDYRPGIIDSAIARARQIPRKEALKKVERSRTTARPVFATAYHPALPSISSILVKHWRTMVGRDSSLKEIFPEPPMVAYKKQPTIKDKLIRNKVTDRPNRERRMVKRMKKCNKPCVTCPYVEEGDTIVAPTNGFQVKINAAVDCNSKNILYYLFCRKANCSEFYIGQSKNSLKERFSDHRGYVNTSKLHQATGAHWNLPGHKVSDMGITVLEKIKSKDPFYRKERDKYFINKFEARTKSLNKNNGG